MEAGSQPVGWAAVDTKAISTTRTLDSKHTGPCYQPGPHPVQRGRQQAQAGREAARKSREGGSRHKQKGIQQAQASREAQAKAGREAAIITEAKKGCRGIQYQIFSVALYL